MENFNDQTDIIQEKLNELKRLGILIHIITDLGAGITPGNFFVFNIYARWNKDDLLSAIEDRIKFITERPWLFDPNTQTQDYDKFSK